MFAAKWHPRLRGGVHCYSFIPVIMQTIHIVISLSKSSRADKVNFGTLELNGTQSDNYFEGRTGGLSATSLTRSFAEIEELPPFLFTLPLKRKRDVINGAVTDDKLERNAKMFYVSNLALL